MNQIQIDSDVPLPGLRSERTGLPWSELELRQSFFVPKGNRASVAAGASRNGKRLGRRFTTRPRIENGVEGVRVWRVE